MPRYVRRQRIRIGYPLVQVALRQRRITPLSPRPPGTRRSRGYPAHVDRAILPLTPRRDRSGSAFTWLLGSCVCGVTVLIRDCVSRMQFASGVPVTCSFSTRYLTRSCTGKGTDHVSLCVSMAGGGLKKMCLRPANRQPTASGSTYVTVCNRRPLAPAVDGYITIFDGYTMSG